MMWLTTMNPETRRLIKVEPDRCPATAETMFNLLLGDNDAGGRKEHHIAEHGKEYLDHLDLQ